MRATACLFVSLFCAAVLYADQVTLKNGDRLSGTIVSSDGKTLLLKSEYAGDVTIKWDAIAGIDSTQNLNLVTKDGKRLSGKVSSTEGTLVVAPSAPAEAGGSAPKDTIVAVRDDATQKAYDDQVAKLTHPKLYYFWSGVFDTGLALTRGNSKTASYTLNGSAVRQTAREKINLFGSYIYATDDTPLPGTTAPTSRTTANEISAGARGEYNLTPRLFVFGFGNFATNELQHLNLRQVYGGGFGDHVIKKDTMVFDVFGGFSYDRDTFSAYVLDAVPVAAITKNSAEFVAGEEFDAKFSKKSTLTETFTFYPNLSHTGNYRFQFNSNVATQLKNWLSWQITFTDTYISYPPPGLLGNDLVLSTGLRVLLGKPAKL